MSYLHLTRNEQTFIRRRNHLFFCATLLCIVNEFYCPGSSFHLLQGNYDPYTISKHSKHNLYSSLSLSLCHSARKLEMTALHSFIYFITFSNTFSIVNPLFSAPSCRFLIFPPHPVSFVFSVPCEC